MIVDYLIVGAGLTGAVFARGLADAGKRVRVIEQRLHIGGNCYDENVNGVLACRYGGHIFHTNSREIWNFVNRFAEFTPYEHRVKVSLHGTMYSFPPNLMTYQQLGIQPGTAGDEIIYEKFFRGYSEKQWGRVWDEIPARAVRRIPFRRNWDDRYFSDRWQGVPVGGYTRMIGRMLDGIDVEVGIDFNRDREYWRRTAERVIYTGALDALFDYELGELEWRSLEHRLVEMESDEFGCATVNYPSVSVKQTRVMSWRYFGHGGNYIGKYWPVTYEYPRAWERGAVRFYPVVTDENERLSLKYRKLASEEGMITAGRLGNYLYLNMDQAVGAGLTMVKKMGRI